MSRRVTQGSPGDGFISMAERIRWLLCCRVGMVAVLFAIWLTLEGNRPDAGLALVTGLGWLALTAASTRIGRRGRRTARAILTASLLGDGVLLTAGWWALGGLDSPVGYLVVLHGVAVTLLASFRTGTKLALWNSVLALLVLEANAAGVLGPAAPVPMARLCGYLGAVWLTVLTTASFAAMNERELRRRRYDAEVLRRFGLAMMTEHDPAQVATLLVRFAHEELQAGRCAVVVRPREGGAAGPSAAFVAVTTADGAVTVHRPPTGVEPPSDHSEPTSTTLTRLSAKLDPEQEPYLDEVMPAARNVIEVPFTTEEVAGLLVVEYARRSLFRALPRVERRVVNTAEQATAHAAAAIGRALLTDRIRKAAETDGLTGVANRRRFDAAFATELKRATPFAVVLIDLDHFKQLNDQFGHLVGDQVLRQAAQAIQSTCGDRGLVARYGGEEFAVILPGVTEAAALDAAERIRRAVAAAPTPAPVTASLGVAGCPPHGRVGEELLAAADAALYRAKAGGRDRAVLASDSGSPDRRTAASLAR